MIIDSKDAFDSDRGTACIGTYTFVKYNCFNKNTIKVNPVEKHIVRQSIKNISLKFLYDK